MENKTKQNNKKKQQTSVSMKKLDSIFNSFWYVLQKFSTKFGSLGPGALPV